MRNSRRMMLGAAAARAVTTPFGPVPEQGAPKVGPLPRVELQPDRIIRQAAGPRPCRPSGLVPRAEALGDTTLIPSCGLCAAA